MISNLDIGKRIESCRKRKGWTQQELADRMDLPRTAITQIEQDKRNVSAVELYRFSNELGFPVSDFFTESYVSENPEPYLLVEDEKKPVKERVSIPPDQLNYRKFKNILLYLLEKCAGKPNVGESVLYKLLYIADFNHYEGHELFLTGDSYRKLHYGPVPIHLDQVLEKMTGGGELQKIKTDYFGYPQTRYLPLVKSDLEFLSATEKETLDQIIDRYADWSASAISDFSHKDLPWRATDQGDIIDYELAFYREPPFSARTYTYDQPEEP